MGGSAVAHEPPALCEFVREECTRALSYYLNLNCNALLSVFSFLTEKVSQAQQRARGLADVLTTLERLYHGEPSSALLFVTVKPHRSHVELHARFPSLGLPHFDV